MTEHNPYAPQEETFINSGEFAYRGFADMTWPKGERQPVPYDASQHNWKATYHHVQAFPTGRQPDFEQYIMPNRKEWHILYKSLSDLLDGNVAPFLDAVQNNHFQTFWAKWEKVVARTYKKDGEDKNVYAYKFLALYKDQAEHDVDNGYDIDSILDEEEKATIPKVPIEAAIDFISGQAKKYAGNDGKVDTAKLAAWLQSMSMLSHITVDMPEVKAAISEIENGPIF